jgi:hypothetical protein
LADHGPARVHGGGRAAKVIAEEPGHLPAS